MDSLANYDSDGENSNNSVDIEMQREEKYNKHDDRHASDVNYDPVQMDMSEDSNNNNSTGDSGSDETCSPPTSHQSSNTLKSNSIRTRTPPSEQRRSDHESNTSNCRGESKRTEKNRTRNSIDDKSSRRSSNDSKRQRDADSKDTKKSRDSDKKSRDDERRRDKNSSSSSSRDDRKDDRDKKDKNHYNFHRNELHERRRDRDRRRSRTERHREERSSSHQKEKDRVRSRSRSKERTSQPCRPMTYREEKSRNKLAQLEKLGIELKAPEGTITTPVMLNEQNYYNPSTTASQGKYAEQIQKRKLLWANKSKQEDRKATTTVIESTANTWVGTTFTQDQDGKLIAKFKRLMGIKNDVPVVPPTGQQKPDILKKQEEMFSNMEQQYEVARATTHTQRGVGLGYTSGGCYQFPR